MFQQEGLVRHPGQPRPGHGRRRGAPVRRGGGGARPGSGGGGTTASRRSAATDGDADVARAAAEFPGAVSSGGSPRGVRGDGAGGARGRSSRGSGPRVL